MSVVLGAKDQQERADESARLLDKGLKTNGLAKPSLYSMRPYGENRLLITDLRPQVCSAAARKARNRGRNAQGQLTLNDRYIKPLGRSPRAVQVSLTGRVPAGLAGVRIPVPTPRPFTPGAIAQPVTADAGTTSRRNRGAIPIPTARPSL